MLPWFTDRLPTAEDADPKGFVVYTQHKGGLFMLIYWQNLVIPRTPWLPYSPPQPAESSPELIPSAHGCNVPRKVQQLFFAPAPSGKPFVLADDGTLWIFDCGDWSQIKTLPDREEEL